MTVTYTDKIKQGGNGLVRLEQATKLLEEILGPSASLVKAEWDCREDARGRTRYRLRLWDWTGEVAGDFAPDELQSTDELRYRLRRLWGDLLQVRSQRQLEQLIGADGAGE